MILQLLLGNRYVTQQQLDTTIMEVPSESNLAIPFCNRGCVFCTVQSKAMSQGPTKAYTTFHKNSINWCSIHKMYICIWIIPGRWKNHSNMIPKIALCSFRALKEDTASLHLLCRMLMLAGLLNWSTSNTITSQGNESERDWNFGSIYFQTIILAFITCFDFMH
jgi:hypothetical protein